MFRQEDLPLPDPVIDESENEYEIVTPESARQHNSLSCIKLSIQEDDVASLSDLVSQGYLPEYISGRMTPVDYCARYNSLICFEYLINKNKPCSYLSFDYCAAYGSLKACILLKDVYPSLRPSVDAMDYAAKNGNESMVIWLAESGNGTCTHNAFDNACEEGYLGIAKFLYKLYPNNKKEIFKNGELFTENSLVNSIKNSRKKIQVYWEIINYLVVVVGVPVTMSAICESCSVGDIDILKFICDTTKISISSTDPMDQACISGNIEIVKYLREIHLARCTRRALNFASRYGHVSIVEYLVKEFNKGTNVSRNKKIPIVPLFEEPDIENIKSTTSAKRRSLSEYIETQALNWACEFGHLKIAKILLFLLGAKCTDYALEKAIDNNYEDIVKFILKNINYIKINDTIVESCKNNKIKSLLKKKMQRY